MSEENCDITVMPIDGSLDLHSFPPGCVGELVEEYLRACRAKGIFRVRIIHGKGRGSLRRTVHGALARLDFVSSWRLAGEDGGGWGATLVELSKDESEAGQDG